MRQIVLDTETTGIDPAQGHKIIEIGCVEMINRNLTGNNYHVYLNPEKEMDQEVMNVHGITNEFLVDKPHFADVAQQFLDFIKGAELIIHNAAFDLGFIDHELSMLTESLGKTKDYCSVTDTLLMSRKKHPGQRNSLDALCKRYSVDNSHREFHGALLDSNILADVYLLLTGGQTNLSFHESSEDGDDSATSIRRVSSARTPLKVIKATKEEMEAHEKRLQAIEKSAGYCLWKGVSGKTVL